jgi:hypothetical protein
MRMKRRIGEADDASGHIALDRSRPVGRVLTDENRDSRTGSDRQVATTTIRHELDDGLM